MYIASAYLLRRLQPCHATLEGDAGHLLRETGHHSDEGLEANVQDLIDLSMNQKGFSR